MDRQKRIRIVIAVVIALASLIAGSLAPLGIMKAAIHADDVLIVNPDDALEFADLNRQLEQASQTAMFVQVIFYALAGASGIYLVISWAQWFIGSSEQPSK